MATPKPGKVFFDPDNLERSVWVVVDPRDSVTGGRVPSPLQVRLKDVAAEPIAARSGVYCFIDLNLSAVEYTVEVRPQPNATDRFFNAEKKFTLEVVPVPANPLKRNPVTVKLLPRPSYPFDALATLVRGRLKKTSDGTPLGAAKIFMILDSLDLGLHGQTDERGEFVTFIPSTEPQSILPPGPLKDFTVNLRFEIAGQPPHLSGDKTVKEGTTKSLGDIKFPGT